MSTKSNKNSDSKTKNKKQKSEIDNKKSRSEYKNKKSKEKPIIKVQVWAEEGITKDVTSWDNMYVINFLKNIDLDKYWKGKFLMYRDIIIIKSNSTSFKKKYSISNVIGYFESPFNNKILSIGIRDEESMLYLFLRFNDINDKDKIITEFDALRRSNEKNEIYQDIESEINPNKSHSPNNFVDKIEDDYANINENQDNIEINNSEMFEKPIVSKRSHKRSIGNEETFVSTNKTINERRTPPLVMKTMPAIIMNTELGDNRFDDFEIDSGNSNRDNVMWIENTKYIDYSPALGMNIQSDDGSIYIYCAHQVGPRLDEYYSDDSDSD